MEDIKEHLKDISEMRAMMERNSKFLSLSGLSGVSAGLVALAGAVAHELGNPGRHVARGVSVVAQLEHDQRIAQAGEAEADAALVLRFLQLLLKRPVRQRDRASAGVARRGRRSRPPPAPRRTTDSDRRVG